MSKPEVVRILVEIIRRYEIILIQEIRDISGTAILELLDGVNKAGSPQYGMTISDRLGKSTVKEQYAFFYKLEVGIEARATYLYPDPGDIFEREPYSVLFSVASAAVPEFVLSAIRASPTRAVEEINQLPMVHKDLINHWKNKNILTLGDFNADCSYVTKAEMKLLTLHNTAGFHWWIPSDADTTVTATHCAYDRFVMSGNDFINAVVSQSARVFHFDQAYGLDNYSATKVSDRYPIELSIQLIARRKRDGDLLSYIELYKRLCIDQELADDINTKDVCSNLKQLQNMLI